MNARRKHHEKNLRRRVEQAFGEGNSSKRKRDVRMYLNSLDAKVHAVAMANRGLKPHQRVAESSILNIARHLDPWSGTTEEVTVRLRYKGFKTPDDISEFRPIHAFGIEHRSLQQLVLPILRASANLHERQYSSRGGVHQAIREVKRALKEGYTYAREFDLNSYFPSLDREGLAEYLPLPTKVTNNVVTSAHYSLNVVSYPVLFGPDEKEAASPSGDASHLFVAEVQRGIPQGSTISPLVSEMILSDGIEVLASNSSCRIINFADNVLVMAKKSKDCGKLGEDLSVFLENHCAGPLSLNPPTEFKNGGPIIFLGHTLTKSGSDIQIVPSWKNQERCKKRIRSALRSALRAQLPQSRSLAILDSLENYISSWTASFSLWSDANSFKKRAHELIQDARDEIGGS